MSTKETKKAGLKILKYADKDNWVRQQLELYTFGEFKSFITRIDTKSRIGTTLTNNGSKWFSDHVREDSKSVSLKFDQLEHILVDQKSKTLAELDTKEFDQKTLKASGSTDISIPAIKYILDRKQSRRQCALSSGEVADA